MRTRPLSLVFSAIVFPLALATGCTSSGETDGGDGDPGTTGGAAGKGNAGASATGGASGKGGQSATGGASGGGAAGKGGQAAGGASGKGGASGQGGAGGAKAGAGGAAAGAGGASGSTAGGASGQGGAAAGQGGTAGKGGQAQGGAGNGQSGAGNGQGGSTGGAAQGGAGQSQGGAGSGQAGVGGDAQGGAGSGQAGAGGDAQGGAGQAGGGGAVAVCGDGVVDAGEECDDGNVDDTDGCVAGCLNATCGDGFVRTGVEACDDGNQDNADGCTNACALPSCGDGFLQAGEVCDDGNADNTDACTDKCQAAACGDGFLQAGEACDDGNQDSTDGCTTTCQLPACGDGFVQAGEACDDGNQVNTDACLDSCVKARCGDMIVQAGVEECDDGNLADADGCSNACLVNFCGNGVIDPGEQCDGANLNNQTCATATGDPKDIGVIKCQTDCLLDTSDCKEPCVTQSAQATLKKKPVDIIFVIDNSGSMTQEIQGVQNNINASFASIIGASGLDYRIIMFSKHGSATADQSICITSPLSGAATCTPPPAKPVFSSTFFQYSVEVASTNSLALLITDYTKADTSGLAPKGWSDFLRPTAFKIFVEITDDNQSATYTAATFDKALLALSPAQFGTAAKRNYLWHSIVGVKENAPATKPYQPGDALVATKCSTAVNPGTVYQNLSIMTGGLRFPLCNISSYDAVFQQIATGIVEGSAIECAFPIPMPANTNIDPATVEIEYTPGNGGPKQTFSQVPDLASCQPGKIYIANNIVNLCPATCTSVQADTKAAMSVLYGCKLIQ